MKKPLSQEYIEKIRTAPPRNMSVKELALYLGVSVRKVRADYAVGILPGVRLGGRIIFRLEDIERTLTNLSN